MKMFLSRKVVRILLNPLRFLSTFFLILCIMIVYHSQNITEVIDDALVVHDEMDNRFTDTSVKMDLARSAEESLSSDALPWIDSYLGSDLLVEPKCEKDLLLIILVASSPQNEARRNAIRKTWARDNIRSDTPRYQTYFILGADGLSEPLLKSITSESETHGDVFLGSFVDSYRNLTRKVLRGMAWVSQVCDPKYLLKTDDDCFVDPDILCEDLIAREESGRNGTYMYLGYRIQKSPVIRDPRDRWYVRKEDYLYSFYPPYASGFGYVISSLAIRRFVVLATLTKPFPVEDAYVGVLAAQAGVPMVASSNFVLSKPNNTRPIPCHRPYVVHEMKNPSYQYIFYQNAAESRMCKLTSTILSDIHSNRVSPRTFYEPTPTEMMITDTQNSHIGLIFDNYT